jgi:hypothetical protein
MSELINKNDNRATIRWKLLTGVSALALIAYVSPAIAEDASQPQVWIELGGQLNRLQDSQEIYAPPFVALTPAPFSPPQNAEKPPRYGIDENVALTFQPEGSNWDFSASIRYGRASSSKHVRHQSYPTQPFTAYSKFYRLNPYGVHHHTNFFKHYPKAARFTDAAAKESENHVILDFQAGKDVGLGLFGQDASSTLNVGVRIAQFRSKSRSTLKEDPDWQFKTQITHVFSSYYFYGPHIFRQTNQDVLQPYHSFAGAFRADRSFSGVGPSISWSSSVPFAGNPQNGALSVDWGVNAALLFGRQKTKIHHQTTARYTTGSGFPPPPITYQHAPPDHARSRRVTVPNVGGFAGISFNYADAKVSLGYRADFFFGAIDGGIDTRKNENRAFNGPYASVSIGLGD